MNFYMKVEKNLRIIGRLDKADFTEFALEDIDIKMDTGAYTSSIHCHNIREVKYKSGRSVLKFNLLDPSHPDYSNRLYTAKNYEITTVKSSTGHTEIRYVITTEIILFGISYDIELTLSDRSVMKYPILIGRKLLLNNFVVDVSETYLSFKTKHHTTDEHSHTFPEVQALLHSKTG